MIMRRVFGIVIVVAILATAAFYFVQKYQTPPSPSLLSSITGTVTAVSENELADGSYLRAIVLVSAEGEKTALVDADTLIYKSFRNEDAQPFMVEVGMSEIMPNTPAEITYNYEEGGTLHGVWEVILSEAEVAAGAYTPPAVSALSGTLVGIEGDTLNLTLPFGEVAFTIAVQTDAATKIFTVDAAHRARITHARTPASFASLVIGQTIYIEGEEFTGESAIGPVATIVIAPAVAQ